MKAATIALTIALSGCATYAQIADVATTAIAIESGLAIEGNPVWGGAEWPIMFVVKLGAVQVLKETPKEICEPGLMGFTLVGSGAALWNIGIMAGAGPAALPFVAALWVWQWDNWTQDSINDCQQGILK